MSNAVDVVVRLEKRPDDTYKQVVFYAHWEGYRIEDIIARALDRGRERWDDNQYLARIIFSELIKDDIDGLTGYGIDTEVGAGDKVVTVDIVHETVDDIPFEEFIKQY